ncbi:MAG: NAD(+)/NADH kinase [Clostridia bacterium]|nr:NAD(+)/NADH kinase [Clostridia bacterium]
MKVCSIGLMVHPGRADSLAKAQQILSSFQKVGITAAVEPWVNDGLPLKLPDIDAMSCDAMVSLGGDGTFLRSAQIAIQREIPLLGINLGRVGFLTEVELSQVDQAAMQMAEGNFSIEKRMILSVQVNDEKPRLALNDAVISRGGHSRLITIDAHISKDQIGRYIADGVIVATPTGSTGYSLSAGGPIISPGVPCMVITPICAHSLQHRPVVVPEDANVHLHLRCEKQQGITLTIDGQDAQRLEGSDRVAVSRASEDLQLIRFKEPHFFSLVREKLSQWSC